MAMPRCALLLVWFVSLGCGARSELGGGDVVPSTSWTDPGAARLLAPLSTAVTATRTPTLRWSLPKDADGADLELCADRACTESLGTLGATGEELRLVTPLAGHVVYWRVWARSGGKRTAEPSATWELFTSAARGAHDSAWGAVPDFDGDGLADWTLGDWAAAENAGRVLVFYGRHGTVASSPDVTLEGAAGDGFGAMMTTIGDIDGDGFPELAVSTQADVRVFRGGPAGIDPTRAPAVFYDTSISALGSAGDLDGDGYGDFYSAPVGEPVQLHYGGPNGSERVSSVPLPAGAPAVFARVTSGDVDGDGRPDLCVGWVAGSPTPFAGSLSVVLGAKGASPVSLAVETSFLAQVDCSGDVDGDGYTDVVAAYVAYPNDIVDVFRGGPTLETTPATLTFPLTYGADDSSKGPPVAIGDYDGDGYDDFIAGLLGRQLEIISGSAHGLDPSTARTMALPGPATGDFAVALAPNVATGGDLDGDGVVDLVTGAQGYWLGDPPNEQVADLGHAWVYTGGAAGIAGEPRVTLVGPGDDQLTFACDVE